MLEKINSISEKIWCIVISIILIDILFAWREYLRKGGKK